MNKAEYKQYERTVDRFFDTEGISNLSRIADSEPYFSWQTCDCCGTTLGGNRVDANGYNKKTKEILEYSICEDCEYYAEYGCLNDQTMMEIEEDDENA